MRFLVVSSFVTWAACTFPACSPAAVGPRDTVSDFEAATARGDGDAAYALLDDSARARVDREVFVRSVGRERRETPLAIGTTEIRAGSASVAEALVYESDAWRLNATALVLPWDQSTPDAAVDSLLRAWGARRFDVLLRFVPDEARAALDETTLRAYCEGDERTRLERMFAELAEPTRERAQTNDDHALVRFGEAPQKILRLVRQRRQWKVVEIVP